MPDRNMLAQLFLAGRSPEEQAQRMARQHQASGLGGAPGGAAPPPLDMTAPGPWGAGKDPMTTGGTGGGGTAVPIPTPRPDPMVMQTPTSAPSDLAPVIPTPRPADAGLANPALQGVPPDLNLPPMPPSIPGLGMELNQPPMPPPVMGVPPALRGIPQNAQPRVQAAQPTMEPQLDPLMLQRGQMRQPQGAVAQNAQPREKAKPKSKFKGKPRAPRAPVG